MNGLGSAPLQGVTYHPAFGDYPVQYRLSPISGWPDERVADTIAYMTKYAVEDSTNPLIQEDAAEALELGGGDPLLGVFNICKSRFKFQEDSQTAGATPVADETVVEVLIRPADLAMMWRRHLQPIEDCDGYSAYAASLLLALNVPCSFCTVAVDPTEPSEYSHVYVVTYPQNKRVALDCSHGKYVGWECPNPFGKRREWSVSSSLNPWFLLAALAALSYVAVKGVSF